MAILAQENFTNGAIDANVSSTNSSGSTTPGSGNTITFSDLFSDGDFSAKFTLGTTAASFFSLSFTAQAGRIVARTSFVYTASSNFRPVVFRNSSPGNSGHLRMLTDGTLECLNSAGSLISGTNSGTPLIAGNRYYLEVAIDRTAGVIGYRVYDYATPATPLFTVVSTSGQSLGTADIVSARFGSSAVPSAATVMYLDRISIQDLASGWPGPPVAPPSGSLTFADDVEIIIATSVDGGTPVDADGLAYSITPSTGVTQVAAGVFVVPRPAAGSAAVTYTVTVTNSTSGQSAQFTRTVPALPVQGYTSPVRIRRGSEF